jgi:4-carboxymuconolactone decarboxylase
VSEKSEKFEKALALRRKVLGDKYVDESMKNADDFTRPLQEYLVEHAWGAVWLREGLSHKTRSMLNLAILAAINRPNELKLHVRGALNNGVTKEEIGEIFLHTGAYCGAPVALDGFKVARAVFAEMEAEKK